MDGDLTKFCRECENTVPCKYIIHLVDVLTVKECHDYHRLYIYFFISNNFEGEDECSSPKLYSVKNNTSC